MKNLSKFSFLFIFLFILFSLFISTSALAVTSSAEETAPTKATVLATVNIYNAKIVSQEGNNIKISFDIANRQGAQSGARYGVSLVKEVGKIKSVVAEYVFPEILDLNTNTTINKVVTYQAPSSLDGEYLLVVSVKNYSGLPLGSFTAGNVNLVSSIKTVEILSDTCSIAISGDKTSTKKTLDQVLDISSSEKIILTCDVINNKQADASVVPNYETYLRTTYGDVVEQTGGDTTPIALKAGEKKTISLSLPKATAPQFYNVKVSLKEGETSSNSVVAYYRVEGVSATIQNFSLDKESYKTGDSAQISFFFSSLSLSGGKASVPPVVLVANIANKNGKSCIAPINQTLTESGLIQIPASITTNCRDPKASIELKDEKGNILDQKELSFESKDLISPLTKMIVAIFGILLVAGIIIYFINLKKKQNEIVNQ